MYPSVNFLYHLSMGKLEPVPADSGRHHLGLTKYSFWFWALNKNGMMCKTHSNLSCRYWKHHSKLPIMGTLTFNFIDHRRTFAWLKPPILHQSVLCCSEWLTLSTWMTLFASHLVINVNGIIYFLKYIFQYNCLGQI